jgi:predicted permease
MNDLATPVANAIIESFALMGMGSLAKALGYINEKDLNDWSRLIVDFLFPIFTFHSIFVNFNPDRFSDFWPLPVIGFGLMALGALMGLALRFGLKNRTRDVSATFMHLCAVNNYSFLPIIMLSNVFGSDILPLLFLLNIGSTIAYWTIGIVTLGGSDIRQNLKNVFSLNLLAVAAALALTMLNLKFLVPPICVKVFGTMGGVAVPCMLLIIGAALWTPIKIKGNVWNQTWTTVCRLAIIPAVTIVILKLLPLAPDVYNVAFVVGIMPVSVSSAIVTRVYGGSPEFAVQSVVITTVLSIITMPLLMRLI